MKSGSSRRSSVFRRQVTHLSVAGSGSAGQRPTTKGQRPLLLLPYLTFKLFNTCSNVGRRSLKSLSGAMNTR